MTAPSFSAILQNLQNATCADGLASSRAGEAGQRHPQLPPGAEADHLAYRLSAEQPRPWQVSMSGKIVDARLAEKVKALRDEDAGADCC
jgi:hypothetical protein